MDILVRNEQEKDYRRVEEITRAAFSHPERNGYNYPAFMGMELVSGYLSQAKGGKYYESDIYDDSLSILKLKILTTYIFLTISTIKAKPENSFKPYSGSPF